MRTTPSAASSTSRRNTNSNGLRVLRFTQRTGPPTGPVFLCPRGAPPRLFGKRPVIEGRWAGVEVRDHWRRDVVRDEDRSRPCKPRQRYTARVRPLARYSLTGLDPLPRQDSSSAPISFPFALDLSPRSLPSVIFPSLHVSLFRSFRIGELTRSLTPDA